MRALILNSAREMFAAGGYGAVTMRRVADRIEYSPTAIYVHFKDKSALVRELCNVDFRALSEKFVSIARIADPIEKLRRAGQLYVQFGIDNPNHYRAMFMSGDDSDIVAPDAYAFLKAIISEAIEQKLFRKDLTDVELVSQTIWAGIHGVIALHIAKSNDATVSWRPLKQRTEAMVDLLIEGLTRA
jgi:AcrR family transcriptional regulator